MVRHSVFPTEKEKTLEELLQDAQKIKAKNDKELTTILDKFLSNPKEYFKT